MLYDVPSLSISSEMETLIFQFDTNFMKTYASIGKKKKKSNIYILYYVIDVALHISLSYQIISLL